MIAEVQFESPLLHETLQEARADTVAVEQLDATDQVPLRSVCWLADQSARAFEAGLESDRTVADATRILDTSEGHQYNVEYREDTTDTEIYDAVVEKDGIFVSGHRRVEHWELNLRFPDRTSFARFRDRCEEIDIDPEIRALHERDSTPRAEQYGVSEPQREILMLAAREGYFSVPRNASLADLADELDVSSQAASERLRRGLGSLVEHALLTPE